MKKILIVDNEPNIVMSLEYMFAKNDYEVFIARNGQEVLDLLRAQRPQVVVLNAAVLMADGYATAEQVRKNKRLRQCKVISLPLKHKAKNIEGVFSLEADLYITNPFSVKKLVDDVNKLLNI